MEFKSGLKTRGDVQMIIDHDSGEREIIEFPNTVLNKGREAIAASLANNFGGTYSYYINRMIFGNAGVASGNLKYVDAGRNGLFCGTPISSKPVISAVDPDIQSQVVYTSILSNSDAVGETLNEMALQMGTGDLYSMVTFPNLTKTGTMVITWNWRLSFV